jgi:hypothetical protein
MPFGLPFIARPGQEGFDQYGRMSELQMLVCDQMLTIQFRLNYLTVCPHTRTRWQLANFTRLGWLGQAYRLWCTTAGTGRPDRHPSVRTSPTSWNRAPYGYARHAIQLSSERSSQPGRISGPGASQREHRRYAFERRVRETGTVRWILGLLSAVRCWSVCDSGWEESWKECGEKGSGE